MRDWDKKKIIKSKANSKEGCKQKTDKRCNDVAIGVFKRMLKVLTIPTMILISKMQEEFRKMTFAHCVQNSENIMNLVPRLNN